MHGRHGVILLDDTELIFRIYETTDDEWTLFHYHSSLIPDSQSSEVSYILELIGNFFASDYAQHVAEWKMCTRHHGKKLVRELEQVLTISIEDISLHREQELLCKGIFTELW